MNDPAEVLNKALNIIQMINEMPLDETPIFTWDEMEEAKGRASRSMLWRGIVIGAMFVLLFWAINDIFHIKIFG